MEDQLILRPFPVEVFGRDDWQAVARRYREDMADYAGAAIFLFGNKLKDGQVVPSDGVIQEFEVCKEKGLALIPVGATGFVARDLWERVMDDIDKAYPKRTDEFKPLLQTLGQPDLEPEALIAVIVRILELWAQG